jgi:hypothetical protein
LAPYDTRPNEVAALVCAALVCEGYGFGGIENGLAARRRRIGTLQSRSARLRRDIERLHKSLDAGPTRPCGQTASSR